MDLVAICGCPRSGTSALCNLLLQDERIIIFDELKIFKNWNSGSIKKSIIKNWLKPGSNFSYLLEKSGLDIKKFKTFIEQDRKITGEALYKYITSNANIKIFGDKLPELYSDNSIRMEKEYPNMKFIFCQRDGRAVIASHLRKPRIKDNTINNIANLWVRCTKKALSFKQQFPDKCMIVVYEETIVNVDKLLEEVSSFIGLDTSIINGVNFKNLPYYRPVNVDTWKQEVPDVLDKIDNPKFNKLMEFYGYIYKDRLL